MGGITDSLFGGGGDDAGKAAVQSSEIQAKYQREALEYLKETEKLPQEFREAALKRLGGMYGVGGESAEGDLLAGQAERIALAEKSPLYSAIYGGRAAGEEAIMRNAAATGGLRSGNVQQNLYDYNTQLQNKALLDSYNQQINEENRVIQGLGGLANLPSLAPQVAQQTSNIGQTYAQGITAKAQAEQSGSQQGFGNIMGLANIGMQAFKTFSDSRLKTNIVQIGTRNGFNWYSWEWNDKAKQLGLSGKSEGVIADEVLVTNPEIVGKSNGYMTVNYGAIL
jgi:hypothetical protein